MRQGTVLTGVVMALALLPAAARAQETNSQYPPIEPFASEVRAGTLSQADYNTLVTMRDQAADRLHDSYTRNSTRGTANSANLATVMGNINAEIVDSVKSGDAGGVVDASLNGNTAMARQIALPGIANAGLLVDDMLDTMGKLYQARAGMAGANQAAIAQAEHKLDLYKAAIDAGLYVMRGKIETSANAAQTIDSQARAAIVAKTDAALKNGGIKIGAKGKIEISPALVKAAGWTPATGTSGGIPGVNTSGGSTTGGSASGNLPGNASGPGTGGPVTPGGAPSGYDTRPGANSGQAPGYDTGSTYKPSGVAMATPPERMEIVHQDKNGNVTTSMRIGNAPGTTSAGYSADLDAQAEADYQAQLAYWRLTGKWDWGITSGGMGGGGGSAGGSGEGGGGSGGPGSTLYDPQGVDYASLSSNGYGSASFQTIYGTAQVVYGNGWSNVAPIPSNQVAGPSSVLDSPDTHPAGPTSAGLTGPSSAGLTGISSAGATGPSSAGVTGISSAGLTGPSSAMTTPSSAGATTPSSAMTSPSSGGLTGPSSAPGNPDARADLNNDDGLPSLCGR